MTPSSSPTTLDDAATALVERKRSFVEGTKEGGTSLIGDGLASCAMRFDDGERRRSRSIVFATDNAARRRADHRTCGGSRLRRRARASASTRSPPPTGSPTPTPPNSAAGGRVDRRRVLRDRRRRRPATGRRRDRTAGGEPPRVPPEVIADDRPTAWIVAVRRRSRRPARSRMGVATMTFDPLTPRSGVDRPSWSQP